MATSEASDPLGVPALAACYARSRGLPCVAIPIDHQQHPGNTIEQRDARLVEQADAARHLRFVELKRMAAVWATRIEDH